MWSPGKDMSDPKALLRGIFCHLEIKCWYMLLARDPCM